MIARQIKLGNLTRPSSVSPTSLSLLDRLKVAPPNGSDWGRLEALYLPLIRRWLAKVPGLGDEADDVAQEVFIVVVRELPQFERKRDGSFRTWLRRISVNKVRSHRRRRKPIPATGLDHAEYFLDRLEAPDGDLARQWDEDHDRHVYHRLLEIVQRDFQLTTWQAFHRFALDGVPAAQVGEEVGLSEGAVLRAKHRVLKRLREEAGQFLD